MFRILRFQAGIKLQLKMAHRSGQLSSVEFARLKKATTYKNSAELLNQVQERSGQYPLIEAFYSFIVENWDEILRALILIASLVLDDRDE